MSKTVSKGIFLAGKVFQPEKILWCKFYKKTFYWHFPYRLNMRYQEKNIDSHYTFGGGRVIEYMDE